MKKKKNNCLEELRKKKKTETKLNTNLKFHSKIFLYGLQIVRFKTAPHKNPLTVNFHGT